jgi:hypothetical protein
MVASFSEEPVVLHQSASLLKLLDPIGREVYGAWTDLLAPRLSLKIKKKGLGRQDPGPSFQIVKNELLSASSAAAGATAAAAACRGTAATDAAIARGCSATR